MSSYSWNFVKNRKNLNLGQLVVGFIAFLILDILNTVKNIVLDILETIAKALSSTAKRLYNKFFTKKVLEPKNLLEPEKAIDPENLVDAENSIEPANSYETNTSEVEYSEDESISEEPVSEEILYSYCHSSPPASPTVLHTKKTLRRASSTGEDSTFRYHPNFDPHAKPSDGPKKRSNSLS